MRGLPPEFDQKHLQNALDIPSDVVVLKPNDAITERAQFRVADTITDAVRMLSAIHFNNKPPIAADKIHVIATDWLLTDEFEAAESPIADMGSQHRFRSRGREP